jgi:hypothetical protein
MDEFGIELPERPKGGFLDNLSDEQKTKLEKIRKQVEAGELTKEEAKEQLDELGIDFPHHKGGHHFRGEHPDMADTPSAQEED